MCSLHIHTYFCTVFSVVPLNHILLSLFGLSAFRILFHRITSTPVHINMNVTARRQSILFPWSHQRWYKNVLDFISVSTILKEGTLKGHSSIYYSPSLFNSINKASAKSYSICSSHFNKTIQGRSYENPLQLECEWMRIAPITFVKFVITFLQSQTNMCHWKYTWDSLATFPFL